MSSIQSHVPGLNDPSNTNPPLQNADENGSTAVTSASSAGGDSTITTAPAHHHRRNSDHRDLINHRPAHWDELSAAIDSNDHDRIDQIIQSLNGGYRYTTRGVAPLLQMAIENNRSTEVRYALLRLPGVNLLKLLDVVVKGGDIGLAKELLRMGADPRQIDIAADPDASPGMQALMQAANVIYRIYPPTSMSHVPDETELEAALRTYELDDAKRILNGKKLTGVFGSIMDLARQALNEEAVDPQLVKLWNKHAGKEDGRADLLAAILALGNPDTIDELAERDAAGTSSLHRGMRALRRSAPELYRYLKTSPYHSQKPERGPGVELNEKAFLEDGNPVSCRHLIMMWLHMKLSDPKKKPDYAHFKTTEAIEAYIQNHMPDVEAAFHALRKRARENHVVANKDWGGFLAKQFAAMEEQEPGQEQGKLIMVLSPDHAMAAELKIKYRYGLKTYVLNYYDPNKTDVHMRMSTDCVKTFEATSLASLLGELELDNRYFPTLEHEFTLVQAIPSGQTLEELLDVPVPDDGDEGRRLTSTPSEFCPVVVLHAMEGGFDADFKDLHERINTLEPAVAVEWFMDEVGDAPHLALENGHPKIVAAYADLLNELSILDEERAKLFAAKMDGLPGIVAAMKNRHTDAALAFINGVKRLNVPDALKAELLGAKDEDGNPIFYTALAGGHTDVVKGFVECVGGLQVSDEKKEELLAATSNDGKPAFVAGLEADHAVTTLAFVAAVRQLGLPEQSQKDLLSGKGAFQFGESTLEVALREARGEEVEILIEWINQVGFSEHEKSELLLGSPERQDVLKADLQEWPEVRDIYREYAQSLGVQDSQAVRRVLNPE